MELFLFGTMLARFPEYFHQASGQSVRAWCSHRPPCLWAWEDACSCSSASATERTRHLPLARALWAPASGLTYRRLIVGGALCPDLRRTSDRRSSNRGIKPLLQMSFFPSRAKRVLRSRLHASGSGGIANATFEHRQARTPAAARNARSTAPVTKRPSLLGPLLLQA